METRVCKCCGRELPVNEFVKNAFGYTYVCKACNSKNRSEAAKNRRARRGAMEELANARTARLADFTPRELMQELARRGYMG